MYGTGSIYSRKGSQILWCKYYVRGEAVRETTRTSDPAKARRFLKRRMDEVGADRIGIKRFVGPAAERITVGELFDSLEKNYTIRHKLTPQIRSKLKPLRAAFGTMSALQLSDAVAQEYIRIRQEGVPANKINLSRLELSLRDFGPIADATINRETQLLKQAFKLRRKEVGEGPDILKLPEDNVREGFFERAEFEAIVAALPEDLQDFARFDYLAGWRKGELESLAWTELDMEGRQLRLRGAESKNGEPRTIALTGELWEIIQRRWQARNFKDEDGTSRISPLVFFRLKGRGVPKAGVPVKEFRKAWAAACEAAGLPGRYFHDFRRTAARNMRRAGVSEEVAMRITGHKTSSMFKRYNITDDRDVTEALDRTQRYVQSLPREKVVVSSQEPPKQE